MRLLKEMVLEFKKDRNVNSTWQRCDAHVRLLFTKCYHVSL